MKNLPCDVLKALSGKTLATAESCTGGAIGAALTAVPGSSAVYKGGIISYCNEVKEALLQVDAGTLQELGAVSGPVAQQMALGAKAVLQADVAVSVTGLAGPAGDESGHSVGTVFIGYADVQQALFREYHFPGDREQVRTEAVRAALKLILEFA